MKYSSQILKKLNSTQQQSGKLSDQDIEVINDHYDKLLFQFGPNDPRSLHWETRGNQFLRWTELSEISNLATSTLLDIGCGQGDLYPFLCQLFENIEYTGIDINSQSVEIAKERYPNCKFICNLFVV